MKTMTSFTTALATAVVLAAPISLSHAKDAIYGSDLMTAKERAEHTQKLNSFNTQAERDAYRKEHEQKMQQRAKEKGLALPKG